MKETLQILFAIMIVIAGFIFFWKQRSKSSSANAASATTNATESSYLEIQNGDKRLSTFIANAQEEVAIVYPQLVMRWAADVDTAPDVIKLRFVKSPENAIRTPSAEHLIEVDFNYAYTNPYDPGALTRALTHILQNYPIDGGWLTEAIASYSSQLYAPRRGDMHRSVAKSLFDTTYLTDPYDTGARFLFWISQHKRHDIVDQLNRLLQTGNYTPESFMQLTDETLDQLWAGYQASGGAIFTLQNKTPEQIYQAVMELTPNLTTSITPTDAAHWQVAQGDDWRCGFENGFYTASMAGTNMVLFCPGVCTAGHNFAFQVDMTIIQGDSGGIIGRGVGGNGLRFRVGSDGTFDLVNGQTTLIPGTNSPAIKQKLETNTLLMVVEDKDIYLYVNGQYLDHASDTFTRSGYFGFMAVNFGNPTSVEYHNVKIWQW